MCLLVRVLLYCIDMCLIFYIDLLMQHDNTWCHVSFWWDVHRLHVRNMFCLRMCFLVVPYVSSIF